MVGNTFDESQEDFVDGEFGEFEDDFTEFEEEAGENTDNDSADDADNTDEDLTGDFEDVDPGFEEDDYDSGDTEGVSTALTLSDDPLLEGHQIVNVDLTYPLTMEEAQELTEKIRSTANIMWVLIARAHAGKAWEALGYPTFAAYVKEEFDISRSRAYQLLDQSKVIKAIEDATPEGTDLSISEAAARDLKSIIGEVVPDIESRTAGLEPDEASGIVDDIINEYREKIKDKNSPGSTGSNNFDDDDDLSDLDDFGDLAGSYTGAPSGGGNSDFAGAGDYGNYSLDDFGDLGDLDDDLGFDDDDDDIDPAEVRRNVQAAYDLYASLSALTSMPDVMNVINTIPEQRRVQIDESLDKSVDWMISFRDSWKSQPWNSDNTSDETEPGSDLDDELSEDSGTDFDDENDNLDDFDEFDEN